MPKIIVSYRRSDSQAIAGRIFDRLSSRYGDDSVFMDIDNIPFGIDFRTHIKTALAQSDLVVAVIGPRWAGATGDGHQRIDEESDPVRVEVESALRSGVPVLPVLVDGATMPSEKQLPEGLKDLAFINAAPVDTGRDFRQHMDRLIRSIDGIVAAKNPQGVAPAAAGPDTKPVPAVQQATAAATPRPSRRLVWLALPVVAIAIGAAWFAVAPQFPNPQGKTAPQPTTEFPAPPGGQPIPPAPAPIKSPSPPANEPPVDTTKIYRVLPTVSDGILNMRSGPGTNYPLVVSVPAGATGITVGRCRMPDDKGTKPWCEAKWQKYAGWVSSCCVVDVKTGAFPQ